MLYRMSLFGIQSFDWGFWANVWMSSHHILYHQRPRTQPKGPFSPYVTCTSLMLEYYETEVKIHSFLKIEWLLQASDQGRMVNLQVFLSSGCLQLSCTCSCWSLCSAHPNHTTLKGRRSREFKNWMSLLGTKFWTSLQLQYVCNVTGLTLPCWRGATVHPCRCWEGPITSLWSRSMSARLSSFRFMAPAARKNQTDHWWCWMSSMFLSPSNDLLWYCMDVHKNTLFSV